MIDPGRLSRLLALLWLAVAIGCSGPASREDERRSQQAAHANVQLGIGYMREGNLGLAKTKLERALGEDPELPVAHWSYALLQWRLGNDVLAEKHFRRAIDLDPRDSRARNNYASFMCENGRVEEALDEYEVAVENPLYDEAASALTNAGLCAMKIPDLARAEAYFRAAVERDAQYGPALYQMAKVAFQRGHYIQARAFMQRYAQAARHSSKTLWMSYRIERHLGNAAASAALAEQLKVSFPESTEAARLLELERHGR